MHYAPIWNWSLFEGLTARLCAARSYFLQPAKAKVDWHE
jgi:hypothetical protein